MGRPFLRARWEQLTLATYAVEPAVLEPSLPPRCELDLVEGRAFVSLVAFDFRRTRVLGLPWPDFPEINLRFYVRQGDTRGVSFVRELVPSRLVAFVARALYNEPYQAASITSTRAAARGGERIERTWSWGGREHRLAVVVAGEPYLPPPTSLEHFFKEHTWGFGASRRGKSLAYRVDHPVWKVRRVVDLELDVDWAGLYGRQFAPLALAEPVSVVHAEGSEVGVYPKQPAALPELAA